MSITAPLLDDNLTVLPPEVVKALKAIPFSTLVYEIEEGGKVILKTMAKRGPQPPATEAVSVSSPSDNAAKPKPDRMTQLLEATKDLPKLRPGVKPATIEELNEVIKQRAVARYERSLL